MKRHPNVVRSLIQGIEEPVLFLRSVLSMVFGVTDG
jgi:hypothetical protein